MYSIENKERYEIYCRKQWHEIQDYQDIIHGERPILRCEDTYHLEFICENFKDVLRYFANHYSNQVPCMKDYLIFVVAL